MSAAVEVWLDADFDPQMRRVGTLHHDRGQLRFEYTPDWLRSPTSFAVDPELMLARGAHFPRPDQGNFRVFDDSAPDRWGQTLMKRREALDAKDAQRPARVLHAWDFLLGVQDQTRQGALRFRDLAVSDPTAGFLASHPLPAPPVTSLRELEAVAYELTSTRIDNADALRRWLSVLVAPGASLGGARPKANITDTDGSLWIAKFPARDDDRDIGAWEHLTHTLAEQAGIDVPEARVLRLGSRGHATFLVKRFDRVGGRRRFYASAMALLQKDASEGSSYVELAEFLQQNGAAGHIKADLAQLFRRVVFNVAVGNRDDHLRNHGFILTAAGWRLAPAFDVNPNVDKAEHVLNLDLDDPRPSVRSVLSTAPWYGLTEAQGRAVVAEVLAVTRPWREAAVRAGIASAEIDGMAAAFDMSDRPDPLGLML
ncbi:type II toxin-antitoxin system HipA family toxin [uncultured Sphaerotilus sp.]|uniref:type II toxin-antitoxin system HipA family toxin n=1 Tax=uncultured Sphaerotilus sp. TaxID=474984 RepID=UPI0030CA4374